MTTWKLTLAATVALLANALDAHAGSLVINADTSDPAPKAALEQVVAAFEKENPDVKVKLNVYDHEGFKGAIRLFLMFDAPDVVTWYAGERMRFFVDRGLFEDVSDLWKNNGLDEAMASSRPEMTVDGKQYGVPYTYYQWGVYYRKDLFDNYGLSAPRTWDEFLAACKTLKANGITPIAIGTKPLWPAAGWFDYFNLRINGLAFHQKLMAGQVPYSDERVRKVFEYWRPLLENGYFIENHKAYAWQDAVPFLTEGKAGMYLIGNFVESYLKEAGIADKIGFFQFPVIDPKVPLAEDAPTDTVHIPANAENKADARKFLAFAARPEVQSQWNQALGQLPTNKNAPLPDDRFLAAGYSMLKDAAGLAQFYDRDTHPEMAQIGMLGFQKFMEEPDRLEAILTRLEIERRRIFDIRRPPVTQ